MSTSKKRAIKSDTFKKDAVRKAASKSTISEAYQAPALKKMQKLSQVTGIQLKLSGNLDQ